MASSNAFRRASAALLVSLALGSAGCSLKKTDAPDTSNANWRVGRVEQASNLRVTNGESPQTRMMMGLLSGPVGIMMAAGTEKDLGTSAVWQYDIRDGATVTHVQSFSVVGVGDCVRFISNAPANDVPIERLPPDQCAGK